MTEQPVASRTRPPAQRVGAIDAYRGLVMLAIASSGLGVVKVAQHFPDSEAWRRVAEQFQHVPWVGCVFWDMIQPSFMFLVGVAMAFSYAKRQERGQTYGAMWRHAIARSLILIALALLLSSNWGDRTITNFVFVNVLAQIGLGYPLLFLMWGQRRHVQLGGALAILAATWALFYSYPAPPPDVHPAAAGLPDDFQRLPGIEAHWCKYTNAAAAFDRWLLNLFPREEPFVYNEGGYQTLNFLPSVATMIFGLMAGELLRGPRGKAAKLLLLIVGGLAALGAGWGLANCFYLMKQSGVALLAQWAQAWGGGAAGICPIVKRIWTPTWALYSGGWALLILAGFYLVMEVVRFRFWAYPLIVTGANPILLYLMSQLLKPWSWRTLKLHFGWWLPDGLAALSFAWLPAAAGRPAAALRDALLSDVYQPMVQAISVFALFWVVCWWLYRQRTFIRI